jgi:hypothetical protein
MAKVDEQVDERAVPRWVAPAFALSAAAIVPWIVYLALSLPHTIRVHDRTAWVGFDIGLVGMLALTAFLAWRGQPRVALAATATATMLVVDAWFDVWTSQRGADRDLALVMTFVEVGLAAVCTWLALHAATVVRRRIAALARGSEDRVPPPV